MGNDRESKGEKEKGSKNRDSKGKDRGRRVRKKREECTDSELHRLRKSSFKERKSSLSRLGNKIRRGASSAADILYPGRLSGGENSRSRGNSPDSFIRRVHRSLSRSGDSLQSWTFRNRGIPETKNNHENIDYTFSSYHPTSKKNRKSATRASPPTSSDESSDFDSSDSNYKGDTEDPSEGEGRYRSKATKGHPDRQDRREDNRARESKSTKQMVKVEDVANLVTRLMGEKEKQKEESQKERASIAFKAPKGLLKATYTQDKDGVNRIVYVDHKKIRKYRDEIKNTFPTMDAQNIKAFIRRFDYLANRGFSEAEYNHMVASFLSPAVRTKLESNNLILENLSANEFIFNLALTVLGYVPTSDELIKQFRNVRFTETERNKPLDYLVRIESLAHSIGNEWSENERNKEIYEKIARIIPPTLYSDFGQKCTIDALGFQVYPSTQELKIYLAKHAEFISFSRPRGQQVRVHQIGTDRDRTDAPNLSSYSNNGSYGAYGGQIHQVGTFPSPPPQIQSIQAPNLNSTQTGQVNRDSSGTGRLPTGSNPPNNSSYTPTCGICERVGHLTDMCVRHPDPAKREENKKELDRRMALKREREREKNATLNQLNTCLLCASKAHNSSTCTMYPGISPAQEACKLHLSHGIANVFHPTANCILLKTQKN